MLRATEAKQRSDTWLDRFIAANKPECDALDNLIRTETNVGHYRVEWAPTTLTPAVWIVFLEGMGYTVTPVNSGVHTGPFFVEWVNVVEELEALEPDDEPTE